MHRLKWIRTARFEIYRLPHASRFAIPLLAFELEGMWRVIHAHGQPLRATAATRWAQLKRERRVTTLMLTELLTVEPDGRAPVRRTEDDEDALRLPSRWNGDFVRIPSDIGAVAHAGKR